MARRITKDRPGSLDDVIAYFKEKGFYDPETQASLFYYHWESYDWQRKGESIKNWRMAATKWNANAVRYNQEHVHGRGVVSRQPFRPDYDRGF